jgi:hypothetical protein
MHNNIYEPIKAKTTRNLEQREYMERKLIID